ncbi:hypothetical protein OB236_14190 [Paenibacillus sp. WQ 127069]|uniref:SRPBCC family protein n=1 Tax=Paenibacillus baimaensis TaxID=2982185 RepID=A0ABT2UF79_9BACL|nr:hypothetical protein [Paenibacillus sp. WQ 127069]MCU6793267.1 hypothetical protein [Paenibacillus sp. WQ 127069]
MSKIREDLTLAKSSFSHIIDVPVEKVDIGQWIFSLSETEYQRCCPPDHIAVGTTKTEDGRPMSINVEKIGTSLSIQHYIGEVVEKHKCRMVSTTDIFISNEQRTQMKVIWELSVKPVNADQTEFTNSVVTHPSEHLLSIFENQGLTFEQASVSRQKISEDHNRREAPLFAESIARAARVEVH